MTYARAAKSMIEIYGAECKATHSYEHLEVNAILVGKDKKHLSIEDGLKGKPNEQRKPQRYPGQGLGGAG